MTQQDLDKLAEEFENNQFRSYEEGSVAEGFQEGFKKALELVTKLLDNSNHANSYLKQEYVKEFFYLL